MNIKRVVSLALLPLFLGCNLDKNLSTTSNLNNSSEIVKAGFGTVKFKFGFAEKFVNQPKSFGIKAIDSGKINRVKVKIESTSTDFKIERDVELIPGGIEATLSLPLDKLYTVTVTGLNDITPVSGSEIKGYFSLTAANNTPIAEVNQATTPIAKIIEALKVKLKEEEKSAKSDTATAGTVEKTVASPSPSSTTQENATPSTTPSTAPNSLATTSDTLAIPENVFKLSNLDTQALADVVKRARVNEHPSLVNIQPFVDYIVTNKAVPVEVPENAMFKAGKMKGKISGLKYNEVAIVTIGDPSSKQTIVVTPTQVSLKNDTNIDADKVAPDIDYVIDNVAPGEWTTSIVASGYVSDIKDEKESKKKIESQKETSFDFKVTAAEWPKAPANISGSIGNSDQANAYLDPANNIHVVWRQDGFNTDSNSGVIFYSRWNGQSWTTQGVNVSQYGNSDIRGSKNPSIAVGLDRLANVVWSGKDASGNRKVFFNSSTGITWKNPSIIAGSENADYTSLAVDKTNGYLYAVWDAAGEVFLSQYNKTEWSTPIKIGAGMMPKIQMGTDGIAHIVWHAVGAQKLQYVSWSSSKNFSNIEDLPISPNGNDVDNVIDASMDRFNRFHVIWRNDTFVQYVMRSNLSWSQPEIVNQVNTAFMPAKAGASVWVAPTGIVNAAWVSNTGANKEVVRFRRRLSDGWKLPFTKVLDATEPTVISSTTTTTTTTTSDITIKHSENIDGYEDIPLSHVTSVDGKPLVIADNLGNIHVIWSNRGANSSDTDLLHSVKTIAKK